MTYKIGIKKWTPVLYKGEKVQIWRDFWTTVSANDEYEAKRLAEPNLIVKMAQNSFVFGFDVTARKDIVIINIYDDFVVGE